MNAEGMPYWLRTLWLRVTQWYARHYRLVLCESHGEGIRMENPRHINISGPGVHIGHWAAISAQPDASVHLSCWPFLDGDDANSKPSPTDQPKLSLGDYCSLSPGVRLIAAHNICIGESCILAANVYITDADWHDRYHRVFPPGQTAAVRLERNVWLADGVRILKGVTIGENTIVGAGAVVTRDLPPNCIAAGNPARVVNQLTPDAPTTDRKALFEELGFAAFDEQFWRSRLAGNSTLGWLMGLVWPALRSGNRRAPSG